MDLELLNGLDDIIVEYIKFKDVLEGLKNPKIILFGASNYGMYMYKALKSKGIGIDFFCDNNKAKWGSFFQGVPVKAPEELLHVDGDYIVLISSMYIKEIFLQLSELEIKNIYYLIDMGFPGNFDGGIRSWISKVTSRYFLKKPGKINKILMLATDGLGDAIIRSNLITRYLDFFGKENVYFITIRRSVYDFIKHFSDNVIFIEVKKYYTKLFYRLKVVRELNSIGIEKIIVLNFHSQVFLGDLEVEKKYYNKNWSSTSYTLKEQLKLFNSITNQHLELKDLTPDISGLKLKVNNKKVNELPENYVSVGMGAFWEGRMYPLNKFVEVLKNFAEKGDYLVLLGSGKVDREYYNKALQEVGDKSKIIDLTDELTVEESTFVIKNSLFFIGVESGLWNISYALGKHSVVIYGGGCYGQFKHDSPLIHYVTEYMSCFGCGWSCKFSGDKSKAYCIENTPVDKIIEAINEVKSEV